MPYPAGGSSGDGGRRGLARAFSFLLSNDPFSCHDPVSRSLHLEEELVDLHRLLSTDRQHRGPDAELLRCLSGKSGNRPEPDRGWIESSRQAILLLDEDRFVFCCSAGARQLLALGPETTGQIFHYFFQPGKPLLITIERPDRTVGVGRLLAVTTRWKGSEVYLVTVRDVTHLERERMARQHFAAADK
jgi:hypothetical protein